MNKEEQKKNKNWMKNITPEQLFKLFEEMLQITNKRIKDVEEMIETNKTTDLRLKMDKEMGETKTGFRIIGPPPSTDAAQNKDYILQSSVEHFGVQGEKKTVFINELEMLMKKHGVFRISAVLLRKFNN